VYDTWKVFRLRHLVAVVVFLFVQLGVDKTLDVSKAFSDRFACLFPSLLQGLQLGIVHFPTVLPTDEPRLAEVSSSFCSPVVVLLALLLLESNPAGGADGGGIIGSAVDGIFVSADELVVAYLESMSAGDIEGGGIGVGMASACATGMPSSSTSTGIPPGEYMVLLPVFGFCGSCGS
jgi:hypothetical protein